jgi:hypothetical protein
MNAYSYWEKGRDIASGQIVSMKPIDIASHRGSIGGVELQTAGMALSAIAQFGMYLEMRKMNRLHEAQFEERRHGWIQDIVTQWIEEHRSIHGIQRDITQAVVTECEKMWQSVCDNEKVDVPQTILLKISRLTEFIEWNYAVLASANNSLVESSSSNDGWLLNLDASSSEIADEILADSVVEVKSSWWKGALKAVGGLPLFLIPGVGPFAGGGAVGYGIGEMISSLKASDADMDVLRDKLPLLRLPIAVALLETANTRFSEFMSQQKVSMPTRLIAAETEPHSVSFLFQPVNGRSKIPSLTAISKPPES